MMNSVSKRELINQLADARDITLSLICFPHRLNCGLLSLGLGGAPRITQFMEEFDGIRTEWKRLMSREVRNLIQTTDLERFKGVDSIAFSIGRTAINLIRDPMMEFSSHHGHPKHHSDASTCELWSAVTPHPDVVEFIMSKIGEDAIGLRFQFNDRITLEFNAAIKGLKFNTLPAVTPDNLKHHESYDAEKQKAVDFKNAPHSWREVEDNTDIKFGRTTIVKYANLTNQTLKSAPKSGPLKKR